MSEKENNIFVKSGMPLWFVSGIRKLIFFDIVSLFLALAFFLLKIQYWNVILWSLVFINGFLSVSLLPLIPSIIWATVQILGNKIDKMAIENGRCVRPTTWIILCFVIVLNISVLIIFLLTLEKDIFIVIIFVDLVAGYLVDRDLNKYIVDVTERDGEIYYHDRMMSKLEKKLFKLARTFIVYLALPSFNNVTVNDGVMYYKGRVISKNELKFFEWMGWIKIIFWLLFIYYLVTH